jgi:hypothetical protein
VEEDRPRAVAWLVYLPAERIGFEAVGRNGGSDTMLLNFS